MLGDDEDELEDLESLDDLQEDEEDEGPSREGGPDGLEEEDPDAPGPDEDESEQERPNRVSARQAPSQQRRSQTRWQAREAALAAQRKRADEAEARANQLAAERQREEAQRVQALQRDAEQRRATMTPDERLTEEMQEIRAQFNYQRQYDQFQRADDADRAEYNARASVDKTWKRHQAEVERVLKQQRDRGWNVPRAEILANIVGKEVLQVTEQSNRPQPTRRKSVSKPVNSRGDSTSTPGKRGPSSEKEALRKRLENVPL
jgi:hypothetical protein